MHRFFLCTISTIAAVFLQAQDGDFSFGARSAGMAGASLTVSDEYALFNNIGAFGKVENHAVFVGYQHRYNLSEFQVIGGGSIFHHQFGNAGIGYYKFGDDIFSQQKLHFGIGNTLQMVSLGVALDWIQYDIESVGTKQTLAIQFGGIAEITPQFVFGVHVFNINQATIESESNEELPTVMKAGFSYRPTEELMLNIEIEKDLDFDEVFKAGLEYQLVNNVFVRTGIRLEPLIGAFGVGFYLKRLTFDYAFSNDSELGNIHEVSLAYLFKK
ncbi:MAG: hypothetical protein AAGC64_04870 [Bacteroidota bacterium]